MNSVTHLLIGWSIANIDSLQRRDRLLVTIGGVLPDIDSFGILPEIISKGKLDWFSRYHHLLAHNFTAAIIGLFVIIWFTKKRFLTGALFLSAFHIHLLCDVMGGRGPDGYQWPVPYLWPFSSEPQITWQYQWALNNWQNFAITGIFIILIFYLAQRKGYFITDLVSRRIDKQVVSTIRKWI